MELEDILGLLVLAAVLGGPFAWRRRFWLFSRSWPSIAGHVQTGSVKTYRRTVAYVIPVEIVNVEIGYSYSIDGEYYSGFHQKQFSDEQRGWDYVHLLKDQEVSVRYNPRNPDQSYFEGLVQFGAVVKPRA